MEVCLSLRGRLVTQLTGYCGDRDVAEEVVQDTLLVAVEQGERLAEIDRLWGWLWRVAVNRVHSHHRRVGAEQRALARLGPVPPVDDVAEAVATMLLLSHLTGRYRSVMWLRIVEHRTVAETAAALACPTGTVKSLTHRAAGQLRTELAA